MRRDWEEMICQGKSGALYPLENDPSCLLCVGVPHGLLPLCSLNNVPALSQLGLGRMAAEAISPGTQITYMLLKPSPVQQTLAEQPLLCCQHPPEAPPVGTYVVVSENMQWPQERLGAPLLPDSLCLTETLPPSKINTENLSVPPTKVTLDLALPVPPHPVSSPNSCLVVGATNAW